MSQAMKARSAGATVASCIAARTSADAARASSAVAAARTHRSSGTRSMPASAGIAHARVTPAFIFKRAQATGVRSAAAAAVDASAATSRVFHHAERLGVSSAALWRACVLPTRP